MARHLGVTAGTLSVWRFFKRDDQLIRLLYQYKKQSNIRLDNQNFGNPYVDTRDTEYRPEFCCLSVAGKNAGDATNVAGLSTQSISGNPEIIRDSNSGAFGNSRNQVEALNYKSNRYRDEFVVQLKGVVALGVEIVTRVHKWTLNYSQANGEIEPNCSNLEFCQ